MKYARRCVSEAEGYVPGEQPTDGGYIKLNTNENPYPPSPHVIEALRKAITPRIRLYPPPTADRLRDKLAEVYGFSRDEIIVTNGMDELLSLIVRTFVEPNDAVVVTYPTYMLYETLVRLHGAQTVSHELGDGFSLPESVIDAGGRVLFLSRPNSPTGTMFRKESVTRAVRAFDGIAVIDEAYVDFADDNCLDLVRQFDNVIIVRTFSKSFSLAGLRIGFGIAHPGIIADLMKVKDSYNVNTLSQVAAIAALEDYPYMQTNVEKIKRTRHRLTSELKRLRFTVPESQANFLLAFPDGFPFTAEQVYIRLKEVKILVRYFPIRRLENSLRITVGTDDEIDALLTALRDLAK